MAKTMGRYCKAYPITRFREYEHWKEKAENARKEKKEIDGKEVEVPRELTENDYLYLHENYVVTDGIYLDENVIFDDVTEEWKKFCDTVLNFEIPDFESEQPKTAEKEKTAADQEKEE